MRWLVWGDVDGNGNGEGEEEKEREEEGTNVVKKFCVSPFFPIPSYPPLSSLLLLLLPCGYIGLVAVLSRVPYTNHYARLSCSHQEKMVYVLYGFA